MKVTRKSDTVKKPQEKRAPTMRAPQRTPPPSTWEPIPLQIPLPLPERERGTQTQSEETPRGVIIIQYGDES